MRKLRTPQQYGYTLEELNDLRPLQVDDKVRQVICIPTHNELADSSKKSALGRLAKGTQQGGAIIHHNHKLNTYEWQEFAYSDMEQFLNINFSQPVKEVLLYNSYNLGVLAFYWCTSNYLIMIKDLNVNGVYNLKIKGTTFDVYFQVPELSVLTFEVYGFY